MSGRNPTTVPPWTGPVLVILAVGAVAFGATGGAAAMPAGPADVGDAIDAGENSTEGSTKTIEETTARGEPSAGGTAEEVDGSTSDITEEGDSTVDTVGSGTEHAVNTTAEAVAETTASTADTVDVSAGLSTGDLSGLAASALDADAVLSSASGPVEGSGASSVGHDRRADDTAVSASATDRAGADTDSTGSGADHPTSPLAPGGVALAGVVVGGVAVLRGMALTDSLPGSDGTRIIRRGVAGRSGTPWRDRFWRVLGAFGYQRFDDSDPLEHDTRAAVYRVIQEAGGAYLSAISRATAIPLSTVRYHLRILEHERVVTPAKLRGKRFYFPADSEPSALRAAMTDDGSGAVLRALARHGPDSVSGLATTLGRDVSTVSHHLQQLADAGLVRRERDGRAVVNRLEPAVRGALAGRADEAEHGLGTGRRSD